MFLNVELENGAALERKFMEIKFHILGSKRPNHS